jgi:hypothetical protein
VEKEEEEKIKETEEDLKKKDRPEEEKKGEIENRPMTDKEPENDKAICENGEEGKTEL